MPIRWTTSRTPGTGNPRAWLPLVLAVPLILWGASGLWIVSDATFHGTPIAARVIEHHAAAGSSRMASVVARVEIGTARGDSFRKELEDQFGVMDWVDGGTVRVRCVDLEGGDPRCGLDSMLDLWLQPAVLLLLGLGLGLWWWRLWSRQRGR
jgi:hypothetical protein